MISKTLFRKISLSHLSSWGLSSTKHGSRKNGGYTPSDNIMAKNAILQKNISRELAQNSSRGISAMKNAFQDKMNDETNSCSPNHQCRCVTSRVKKNPIRTILCENTGIY
ncbi:hypothetical protein HZS_1841 [Henneguya salminicola]|nr:hypothetical protein HZS_1841 [Henneguya salminicola]